MTKYYVLEYVHDEEGVSVVARPNGAERNDYFVRTVAYVDFTSDTIHFQEHTMRFEMAQEICNHLHELHTQHLQYLDHLNRKEDSNEDN